MNRHLNFYLFFILWLSVYVSFPLFGTTDLATSPDKIIIFAEELNDDHLSSFLDILPISSEEGWKSLVDFLKYEKGIALKSTGPKALTTINIRGSTKAEQILVFLDGLRLNPAQGGGVDLSKIPLSMVEKIEIIRGTESALYGADAVGGVINIVTRKKSPPLTYSFSRDSWGKGGLKDHKLHLTTGKKLGGIDLFLNAHSERNQADFSFVNPITRQNETRENNASLSRGFLLKSTWSPSNEASISLTEEFFVSKQKIPAPLGPDGLALHTDGNQDNLRLLSELKSVFKLSENRKTLTLRFPVRQDRLVYRENTPRVGTQKWVYKNFHLGPKVEFSSPFGDRHLLGLFAETTFDTLDSLSHLKRAQKINWGAAIKDDLFLSQKWIISPTLRFDHAKNLYSVINPKLGVAYAATPWFLVKSNLSKGFRSPSFDELYMDLKGEGWSYLGNQNLKPETSLDGDIGCVVNRSTWKWENAFFVSRVKDLISNKTTFSETHLLTFPENLETNLIWGTESSFESKFEELPLPFFSRLTGMLNYTWLHTDLPYRPQHSINTTFAWENTPGVGISHVGTKIFISHHYLSTMKTNTPTRPKLSLVHLMNAGIIFRLAKEVTLTAEVDNLFNRAYERIAYYPMPGRTLSLNISGTL